MDLVILEPPNLPERLRMLADSLPAQGRLGISNLVAPEYMREPLPETMMEVVQMNCGRHEVSVAECIQYNGCIQYRGNE